MACQKPSAPSAIASSGPITSPRRFRPSSSPFQDCAFSRLPSQTWPNRPIAACSDKVSAIFAKPGGSEIAAGPPLRQRGPAVRLASCERRIGALPPFTGTRVKAPLLPMADHHRRPMGQAGGENHTDPPSREPRPEHHR
jgi:hypothetical protein